MVTVAMESSFSCDSASSAMGCQDVTVCLRCARLGGSAECKSQGVRTTAVLCVKEAGETEACRRESQSVEKERRRSRMMEERKVS